MENYRNSRMGACADWIRAVACDLMLGFSGLTKFVSRYSNVPVAISPTSRILLSVFTAAKAY